MNQAGQTICLNMIVRNEASIIRRCLDSVIPIIDSWVIVDTGSTDGTQDIVREHLRGIPGELHERPWVDFASNRSEALALARARGRADYIFVIDADEVLERDEDFALPALEADSYNAAIDYAGCLYLRRQLLRAALPWRYEGVLHEYSVCDEARTEGFLAGIRTRPHHDGARARDPDTYRRDALVLEQALADEPDNPRYVFYLAQSYRDAGEPELALRHYRRRAAMGGWTEEVWYSHYQIAQIRERIGDPWPEVMQDYLAAWRMMPDRAGPLYRIGLHHQAQQDHPVAHLFLSRAMQIAPPGPQRLFVEQSIYDYLLPLQYAVSCFYVGDHAAAIGTNNRLLASDRVPPEAVDQLIRNRRFSVDAVAPIRKAEPTPGLLHLFVRVEDGGPALDDCVESIRRQQGARFRAVFCGPAAHAHKGRLALEDARLSLAVEDPGASLAAHASPDDPVLLLNASRALADDAILARIREIFDDPECRLAYGQHRRPDGRLGYAQPASDESDFMARRAALADGSPPAIRASLLTGSPGDPIDLDAAFAAAGYAGARFSDEVWVNGPAIVPDRAEARPAGAPAIGGARPRISCVMVTYDRLALAKRAVRSYALQSWPERELVVVTDGTARFRDALGLYVDALGIKHVRIVHAQGESLPLGQLRNLSLDEARGDIVCQWDDDDFSHPDRLAVQAECLESAKAGASLLNDHLQYLADQRALGWVDWTASGRLEGEASLAPGTLMMRAGLGVRYPEEGDHARLGEDSVLLSALEAATSIAPLRGSGHLYLYQYHGGNAFSRDHHERVSEFRTSAAHLAAHADRIRDTADRAGLPRPCFAVGCDGTAFVL